MDQPNPEETITPIPAVPEEALISSKEKGIEWTNILDGPWLGLAIGVVAGSVASVSPTLTLPWIFFAAFLFSGVHLYRHIFRGKNARYKIISAVVWLLMGFVLYVGRKRLIASLPPSPKDPPTAQENAKAVIALENQQKPKQDIKPESAPRPQPPPKIHHGVTSQPKAQPETAQSQPSTTNAPSPPPVAKLTVTQKLDVSDRLEFPYKTQVVVQSSLEFPTLRLAVECNGPIGDGDGGVIGVSMMVSQGVVAGHPNIYVLTYQSATSPLSPASPLTFYFWSKEPILCTRASTF